MANQQVKRRRKRYAPGSAYAGDVRPSGILGILSSPRTMRIVFIGMAVALAVGALGGGIIRYAGFGKSDKSDQSSPAREVVNNPSDNENSQTPPQPTVEVKHYSTEPAMTIDPTKTYTATITTASGVIQVQLLPQQAPETVNNFVFLARDHFYDGLVFHEVEPGFSVQAGDPRCSASNTTCRGDGGPGYSLNEQIQGTYAPGTIGMANGSQFFIALTDSSAFNDFTPFATVTSGLDVAENIRPNTVIDSITISEA